MSSIYFPPEWSPQSGIMLTWPHHDTIWADTLDVIDQVFVKIVKIIAAREVVLITCCDDRHQQHIQQLLALPEIRFFKAPSNDIWVRDHGPISIFDQGSPVLLDFTFNGWGNKYPADQDNALTHRLHRLRAFQALYRPINMVLEGGALETDGQGTLLTTQRCLLANNRNAQWSQIDIEKHLQTHLGIKKILWLNEGYLEGDDTDGHIDTLARFINPHTICYVTCHEQDAQFSALKKMEQELKNFTDYTGQPYRLVPLPSPRPQYAKVDGRRLPATYANFLMINHALLVPTYDDPADDIALTVLSQCFPDRTVIAIPCLELIQWYGSLHCMTMQLPEGFLP